MNNIQFPELSEKQAAITFDYGVVSSAFSKVRVRMDHTSLSLIYDQSFPTRSMLKNVRRVPRGCDSLVRRDQDMILRSRSLLRNSRMIQLVLFDDLPRLRIAVERYYTEIGSPAFKLSDPVRDRRVWYDDQDRTCGVSFREALDDLSNECNNLNGFTL